MKSPADSAGTGFLRDLERTRGFVLDEEVAALKVADRIGCGLSPYSEAAVDPLDVLISTESPPANNEERIHELRRAEAALLRFLLLGQDREDGLHKLQRLLPNSPSARRTAPRILRKLETIESRAAARHHSEKTERFDPDQETIEVLQTASISFREARKLLQGKRLQSEWKGHRRPAAAELQDRITRVDRIQERLVAGNIRLVAWKIGRKRHWRLDRLTVLLEGVLGLIEAIRRFEPGRAKLTTYAPYWIKQNVYRASTDHAGSLRIPSDQRELRRVFLREWRVRRAEGEGEVDGQSILEGLNQTSKGNRSLLAVLQTVLTSEPGRYPNRRTFSQTVPVIDCPAPQTREAGRTLDLLIRDAIAQLKPRFQLVILQRTGLGIPLRRSLKETGKMIGVTRERVRQLEMRAMIRLELRLRHQVPRLLELVASI